VAIIGYNASLYQMDDTLEQHVDNRPLV